MRRNANEDHCGDNPHFNPRTPCGVRRSVSFGQSQNRHFNPRTPCGVRPHCSAIALAMPGFQSTHPVRGATIHYQQCVQQRRISIHAPRAGCDPARDTFLVTAAISIHAPRAGCDELRGCIRLHGLHFNPRTPCGVRRKTWCFRDCLCHFNPRTPCGVRPEIPSTAFIPICISIHAPRAGCDVLPYIQFLSVASISIHAPRAGCDDGAVGIASIHTSFQSTHPVRGATRKAVKAKEG